VLEHFLDDWGIVQVVPFLNVLSGDKRIRIEHGHLYDDMFVRFPRLYHLVTILGGLALRIHPAVYHAMDGIKEWLLKLRRGARATVQGTVEEYIPGEAPSFRDAAERISYRGFDYVVFGHTHKHGDVRVGEGAVYLNTGSWLFRPQYVEIDHGQVTLKPVVGKERGLVRESWTSLMMRMVRRR
jgi:UDP-2,3-diacylglucosamine pyrophosphatase LpxH